MKKLFIVIIMMLSIKISYSRSEIALEEYKIQVKNEFFKVFNIEMKIQGIIFKKIELKIAVDKKKNEKSWFKILIVKFY